MVASLQHERFYESGLWIDEGLGVYVGWVVRKGSFSDQMPLSNERGDVILAFAGEEYPEPDTALRLKERGHAVEREGPSYLVHLAEEDPSFPAGLNGLFHGLLVNRTSGSAMLFNDRFGMHRICYHQSSDAFFFAAEAKAILAALPALRSADLRALGEFVALSCVLENRTIFRNIHVLPAGSRWVFENGALVDKSTYFRPHEWEGLSPLDEEAYPRQLSDIVSDRLRRYFRGPERVGVALTGGLDTRVIMSFQHASPGSLPCYTFGSLFRENQDVRIARRVADVCQQSHQVITAGHEFLERFPQYAERTLFLTEGTIDVHRSPDLYLSEKAREIAPAKIVGTYGSEIVRRAVMFKPVAPAPGLFLPEFLSHVSLAGETYWKYRAEHPVTFGAFRQSPWYHHGVLMLEQTQLSVRSPFLDNAFVRTVYRAPSSAVNDDVRRRLVRDGNSILASIMTDRGVGGNLGRVSSAIARRWLEFTFKAEYAYDMGMPQAAARIDYLLAGLHLERLFLGRHKLTHFRIWYRDCLSRYVQQVLLDPLTLSRPFLDRNVVEAVVHGHVRGKSNYTTTIHTLLSLELLHRLFFDPP
jgi:asparagine synthase (glutamine-hydrolysing)